MSKLDEIEEYTACVDTEEKMRAAMSVFKTEMREARKKRDFTRYDHKRMQADMLANSIYHVEKSRERWERKVWYAFEDAKPTSDGPDVDVEVGHDDETSSGCTDDSFHTTVH